MIFTRSKEPFTTRLFVNQESLENAPVMQLLGVWISEDLSWDKNCQEICKRAYARLSLITKLKYVGVSTNHLLDIYILFIRSVVEYCSVAFHSSLTQKQSNKLEKIQKVCLKVIYGEDYTDYESAMRLSGLQTLSDRRLKRCLDFSLKCFHQTQVTMIESGHLNLTVSILQAPDLTRCQQFPSVRGYLTNISEILTNNYNSLQKHYCEL